MIIPQLAQIPNITPPQIHRDLAEICRFYRMVELGNWVLWANVPEVEKLMTLGKIGRNWEGCGSWESRELGKIGKVVNIGQVRGHG